MFGARRHFLTDLGAGLLAAGGLLLPSKALAGWCRRGRVVCCPTQPIYYAGEPIYYVTEPVPRTGRLLDLEGGISIQYPSPPASPAATIPGNGMFCTWGTISSGNKVAPDPNGLIVTNASTGAQIGNVTRINSPPTTWAFIVLNCTPGVTFNFTFNYLVGMNPMLNPTTPIGQWKC
jgi:hypothetical protein